MQASYYFRMALFLDGDTLCFRLGFKEDIVQHLCRAQSCLDLDIFHPNVKAQFGFLSVYLSTSDTLSTREKGSRKRPAANQIPVTKSKVTKSFLSVDKPGQKLIRSNIEIQPSFQQDPNDLMGTMQSLDSGEKIFSCKLCGLQGNKKPNVRRHIVLKHMQGLKDSFKCTVCEKEFSMKHHLMRHYMNCHNMNQKLANVALTC